MTERFVYDPHIQLRELRPEPYCQRSDRWVVSLLVSYAPEDLADDEFGPPGPKAAAAAALALTRDGGSDGTVWHVYDRETGESHRLEQRDFEDDEG